jgi:hypothetical protein
MRSPALFFFLLASGVRNAARRLLPQATGALSHNPLFWKVSLVAAGGGQLFVEKPQAAVVRFT